MRKMLIQKLFMQVYILNLQKILNSGEKKNTLADIRVELRKVEKVKRIKELIEYLFLINIY